ncbi:MAG: CHAT domain-containing protein [Cyanobacteria bacterium J055]|nr:MAG: CHAT domain-containing protein [Cyanobacteria bacterium J055]
MSDRGRSVAYFSVIFIAMAAGTLPPPAVTISPVEIVQNTVEDLVDLYDLGQQQEANGQISEALATFDRVLVRSRELGVPEGEAAALRSIGLIYLKSGEFQQSITYFQNALPIQQQLGDRLAEAQTLGDLGTAYSRLGEYDRALELHQQALAIKRELGDRAEESTTLNNIGIIYQARGEYARSIEFFEASRAIDRDLGNLANVALTSNNLGYTYKLLGQYDKALEFYQTALSTVQELGDRLSEGIFLDNIGNVYFSLHDDETAVDYAHRALAIFQDLDRPASIAVALNNLAAYYTELQQYDRALEFYQQVRPILEELGDRPNLARVLDNIGTAYSELGDNERALTFSQEAIALFRELGNRASEGRGLNNMGFRLMKLQRYDEAAETLLEAIEVYESLRPGLTDANKVSLFDTQAESYRLLQQTYIALDRPEAALEIAERGRARAFVELLAARSNPTVRGTDDVAAPTADRIRQVAADLDATLVQYSIIPNVALYIWTVRPSGEIDFRSVDLSPEETSIADLVALSREAIGIQDRGVEVIGRQPETDRQTHQQLRELYRLLVEPIADLLPTDADDRVIFLPQGELLLVPFAALQDENGTYLVENHTPIVAPSIQVLQLTEQERRAGGVEGAGEAGEVWAKLPSGETESPSPGRAGVGEGSDIPASNALVVGNPTMPTVKLPSGETLDLPPLPGAEREAIEIAELLDAEALTGSAATETAVRQRLPQADIVHFATHGLLDDFGTGIPGAVVLASGEGNDGLLSAEEIFNLQLNANIVVLSACDTGRGNITGDGVIGLSRSFVTAGVPSAIVSLWAVPDAPTAFLMAEFYRQWQQQPDKARALRQAMLLTLDRYPDPLEWSAFVLLGQP